MWRTGVLARLCRAGRPPPSTRADSTPRAIIDKILRHSLAAPTRSLPMKFSFPDGWRIRSAGGSVHRPRYFGAVPDCHAPQRTTPSPSRPRNPGPILAWTCKREKSCKSTPAPAENCDPAGVSGSASTGLPVVSAPAGALIARLQAQGVPVLVGSGQQLKVEAPGHLFLGVNASGTPPCSGSFAVKVNVSVRGAAHGACSW